MMLKTTTVFNARLQYKPMNTIHSGIPAVLFSGHIISYLYDLSGKIMEEKAIQFELSNGIRIIHVPAKSEIVHCAIMIHAGTRDEIAENTGLAHLIEHCIFKGTRKKTNLDILNSIDSVGGELNAYTTKEETCVYASCGLEYFERAVELLSDITQHSVFPQKEINKEKDVISDEIQSYLDSPAEQIHDDFEEQVFAKHPLGRNILGAEKHMRAVKRSELETFIQKHYKGRKMVFSCTGNIPIVRLKYLAEKYLGRVGRSDEDESRKPFKTYKPSHIHAVRNTYQAHCLLGNMAYASGHKHRSTFILLNNLLGGPAMNSKLNLSIREKYGYTYQLESNYTAYSDSGVFTVYFGTDPSNLNKTLSLVRKELQLLQRKKLSPGQLRAAKEQLCGQVTLAKESRMNVVISNAKNVLLFDKVDPLSLWLKKIKNITAEQILETANEVFDEKSMSTLIFKKK
jgi:predicted Zn-dependent peptidase